MSDHSQGTAVSTRPERVQMAPRLTPQMERMDAYARQAQALAGSTIIPEIYRGSVSNCLVAIDVAERIGVPTLVVMQNLHVIQGKPSWSSTYLIGAVNACGRFSPLRFEEVGEESKPGWKCRAVATARADGQVLDGAWITWEMAQAEGWVGKTGSKWKTMPGQMIRYRAAAFWARIFAPEIALGLMTAEEAEDIGPSLADRARAVGARMDAAANGETIPVARVIGETPKGPTPTEASDEDVSHLTDLLAKALTELECEPYQVAIQGRDAAAVTEALRTAQSAIAKAATKPKKGA